MQSTQSILLHRKLLMPNADRKTGLHPIGRHLRSKTSQRGDIGTAAQESQLCMTTDWTAIMIRQSRTLNDDSCPFCCHSSIRFVSGFSIVYLFEFKRNWNAALSGSVWFRPPSQALSLSSNGTTASSNTLLDSSQLK